MAQSPLTNEEFAEKVGIHFTMASRLKNGQRLPSVRTLLRIAEAFDVPLDDLARAYEYGADEFGALLRDRIYKIKTRPELEVA